MTSGHNVSIQSFWEVYNAGKVDRNYELLGFFFFFWLGGGGVGARGNFANLYCQGYLYFGSREKYFIVSYG